MLNANDDLLKEVESIKNMFVAKATGEATSESNYRELRLNLINNLDVKVKLPRFVHTCRTLGEFWGFIKDIDGSYAGRRSYLANEFNEVLTYLENNISTPADNANNNILNNVDSANIRSMWQRALDRRASDPEGAITLARTLLEATCKYILDELKIEYNEQADLPKLYGLVASNLNLSPSQHIEPIFKQILGGCHSVVQGLGALRSKLGDAHAQGKSGVKPASRHAEFAVNLSGTMATFFCIFSNIILACLLPCFADFSRGTRRMHNMILI